MSDIEISTNVVARDHFGRFISHVERGITESVEEAIVAGAQVGQAFAPTKTGALRGSIEPAMTGAASGVITVGTDHWKYQERGTAPHDISSQVRFFWEREGYEWTPGPKKQVIRHPGNPARHFMRMAYKAATETLKAALPRNI